MELPSKTKAFAWIVGLSAALLIPVVLYVTTFGFALSNDHARWSEFGTYLGGVYAPIAGFITLAIIVLQLASQVHINKHQIDQTYLSNARSDLSFYIAQLQTALARHEQIANVPLSQTLVAMFSAKTHEQLRGAIFVTNARRIGMTESRSGAIWGAIYSIFAGLKAVDHPDYSLVYTTSKAKCIAVLGLALCDALDNLHYVELGYPEDFPYEFRSRPQSEA